MSGPIRSGLIGALLLLAAIVVLVAAAAFLGVYNVAADAQHTVPVRTFINFVSDHSVAARDGDVVVPPLNDPKMIAAGAAHYDSMCTGCHLAPGKKENDIRAGLNPKPPSFARRRRPGNAAEQFWIIKHGIKMTAMPAWGATHSDADIWNIVAFFQTMPKMTPEAYKAVVASAGDHHDQDMPNMNMGR
jgi:mono/diheme cytochrome c family protein